MAKESEEKKHVPYLSKKPLKFWFVKVEEGHFQVACGMHFSAVHLRDLSTGVTNHPNQW